MYGRDGVAVEFRCVTCRREVAVAVAHVGVIGVEEGGFRFGRVRDSLAVAAPEEDGNDSEQGGDGDGRHETDDQAQVGGSGAVAGGGWG